MSEYEPLHGDPWVRRGVISSSTTVLSGASFAGKSSTGLDLSEVTIENRPFLGRDLIGPPGPVCWVGLDPGSRDELYRRTESWEKATRSGLLLPAKPIREWSANYASDLASSLESEGCRLVILDHLTGLTGGRDIDKPGEFYAAIEPLQPLIDAFPFVLIAHANKTSTTGEPAHTHAIRDWARCLLSLQAARGDGSQTLTVTSNEAPPWAFEIERGEDGRYAVLGEGPPGAARESSRRGTREGSGRRPPRNRNLEQARRQVRLLLERAGPGDLETRAAAGRLAEAVGISKTSVDGSTGTRWVGRQIQRGLLALDGKAVIPGPALDQDVS